MRRTFLSAGGTLAAVAIVAACASVIRGEDELPEDRGAPGLWGDLKRLRTTGTVLHITAHPDDEDAALLTYLARGLGVRTILLSLTRGEGGADLIAPHFFDALGVLRTLELLEADRRYGAEQRYTRAVDYGYSKVLDEALRGWGGEENVLEDVVRVVRQERPDVIVARFRGDPRDGHGHHMFAGLMAQRAFAAAADPGRFPHQLAQGLRPWRAAKLYAPASRSEAGSPGVVAVPTGEFDPFLGRSYHQIAREGYGLHRSQGMGGLPARGGPEHSHYRLEGSSAAADRSGREASLLEGLDLSITGIPSRAGLAAPPPWLTEGLGALEGAIAGAAREFDPRSPEKTTAPLAAALVALRRLTGELQASSLEERGREHLLFLLGRKESQLQGAIAKSLALDVSADVEAEPGPSRPAGTPWSPPPAPPRYAVPGRPIRARVRVLNRSAVEVKLAGLELEMPGGWQAFREGKDPSLLGYNAPTSALFLISVPPDAAPTRPHWRRASIRETLYSVDGPESGAQPLPPPPVSAVVRLEVGGAAITVREPARAAVNDPTSGAARDILWVAPLISVTFASEHGIVPLGRKEHLLAVSVRACANQPLVGSVTLKLPPGWRSAPASAPFALAREDEEASLVFRLELPALTQDPHVIEAAAVVDGREYGEGFTRITARGLPSFPLYRPARHTLRGVDVKVAQDLRLAYIMGSGDEVPEAIKLLGPRPDLLGEAELAGAVLRDYDAIIIGVRAYAVRSDVKKHNRRLLDYIEGGGILIVQYQTPEYDADFGPYPYTMTWAAEEVSEEDAAVTLLAPEHALFTAPNRITPGDFDGWVEQRGSKFWKTWDDRYAPLLESHDRGQEPQKGGMLFARYGKGAFVYSAYAWYRQLPFGVPGAYRIFANMISLGRTLAGEAAPGKER